MTDEFSEPNDSLAHIIRAAGRREVPPMQAYERTFIAATHVWQAKLRRHRWRRASALAAGLAMLAVCIGIGVRSLDSKQSDPQPIAQVMRVIGSAYIQLAGSRQWFSLQEDAKPLPIGGVLRTETASAVALRLEDVSVRIAGDAEIVLESQSRVRLVRGKVYVDTGADNGDRRMLVVTDTGSVSDVGTQFEVQPLPAGYRVRVREGQVLMQHEDRRERGEAGEQISFVRNRVDSVTFAKNDPEWRWAEVLASAPDIDDQPLTVLLAWVARETGGKIRYAAPAVERKATTTILHGSIRHLEPLQALAVMMATTDLQHEVLPDGTILIK
jgi:ferric-dicitrate binding protein FerR (iron transport regulator)